MSYLNISNEKKPINDGTQPQGPTHKEVYNFASLKTPEIIARTILKSIHNNETNRKMPNDIQTQWNSLLFQVILTHK